MEVRNGGAGSFAVASDAGGDESGAVGGQERGGAGQEGGWSEELKPDDVVHTLVTVHTDEGPIGYGSVFTSEALVRAELEWAMERLEHRLSPATFREVTAALAEPPIKGEQFLD